MSKSFAHRLIDLKLHLETSYVEHAFVDQFMKPNFSLAAALGAQKKMKESQLILEATEVPS